MMLNSGSHTSKFLNLAIRSAVWVGFFVLFVIYIGFPENLLQAGFAAAGFIALLNDIMAYYDKFLKRLTERRAAPPET